MKNVTPLGRQDTSLASGWYVEPARLVAQFDLDQRGGRSVRLIRIVGTAETQWGPLQECEFQIDRD